MSNAESHSLKQGAAPGASLDDHFKLATLEEDLKVASTILEWESGDIFGHVGVRLPSGEGIACKMFRYCGATPEDWIVHFDFDGKKLAGVGTPPFEAAMYTEIMKRRPDVQAMVHNHSPACIALSLIDKQITTVHLQSSKFAGGVPIYPRPILIKDQSEGQELADALGPSAKAVVIKGHGIIAVGSSIDQACMNAVYLERTAKIQTMALALGFGGPSQDFIEEILGSSRRSQGTASVQERSRARGGYSNEWVYYKQKILQGDRWTRGWS